MFEEKTYENILKEMLSSLNGVDTREGSIVYDLLAPMAMEIAQLYMDLRVILRESFADTASMDYLTLIAGERGLFPKSASNCIALGEFDIKVERGSRFNIEGFNFYVTDFIEEKDGHFFFYLECEESGDVGEIVGELTPIEIINSLNFCKLIKVISQGKNEESEDEFRKRYFDSINLRGFGGNVADYKSYFKENVDGIYGVRVLRANEWAGAGNVKVILQGEDFLVPSDEVIQRAREIIGGENGDKIVPIGHRVFIEPCKKEEIKISADFQLFEGFTFEGLKDQIVEKIGIYFDQLNKGWEESEINILSAKIIVSCMEIEGVRNIENVKINSESGNKIIDRESVIYLKEVLENERSWHFKLFARFLQRF